VHNLWWLENKVTLYMLGGHGHHGLLDEGGHGRDGHDCPIFNDEPILRAGGAAATSVDCKAIPAKHKQFTLFPKLDKTF